MRNTAAQQMDAFTTNDVEPKREPVSPIHVLRLPQVCKMTGLRRSTVYEMEADGRFPSRVKIGLRSVGWIESEVQSWLRDKVERGRSRKK